MQQLVYISTSRGPVDPDEVLAVSRRNNGRDGISGLLYGDGVRFLQVLEGPRHLVMAAFARIKADPRHRAIVVLSDREVAAREFGDWEMAFRTQVDGQAFVDRVSRLIARADVNVQATFASFARLDRAA